MDNRHIIFKSLDNTPRLLFWPIDEFMVMAIPFFMGMLVGSIILMLSGLALRKIYCRWKKRYPKGLLRQSCYWNFPTSALIKIGAFKKLPPSHQRDFFV